MPPPWSRRASGASPSTTRLNTDRMKAYVDHLERDSRQRDSRQRDGKGVVVVVVVVVMVVVVVVVMVWWW